MAPSSVTGTTTVTICGKVALVTVKSQRKIGCLLNRSLKRRRRGVARRGIAVRDWKFGQLWPSIAYITHRTFCLALLKVIPWRRLMPCEVQRG